MKKIFSLLYALVCYFAFFGATLYVIGFFGNQIIPKTIDGKPQTPLLTAVLVDAALLLLVALQYSIIASPAFKRWWTNIIPHHIRRSTYILLASLCLMLLMWQWQSIGGIVWSIDNETVKGILLIIYLIGWATVFATTFLINHFDLFGLKQVWFYFIGKPYTQFVFNTALFYKIVLHPLYVGFLIAFWSTPVMTAAHLVFAILITGYILIAIQSGERDTRNIFGDEYRNYKTRVPMIVPFSKRRVVKK
jgi:protein-S-isoprenylcysteine O-methyltransferase Ste14